MNKGDCLYEAIPLLFGRTALVAKELEDPGGAPFNQVFQLGSRAAIVWERAAIWVLNIVGWPNHLAEQVYLAHISVKVARDGLLMLSSHHQDQVGFIYHSLCEIAASMLADIQILFCHHLAGVGAGQLTLESPDAPRADANVLVHLLADQFVAKQTNGHRRTADVTGANNEQGFVGGHGAQIPPMKVNAGRGGNCLPPLLGLGKFGLQQSVVAVPTTVDNVHRGSVDVEEDKEIVAQEFHLFDGLFFIHGRHGEALGADNARSGFL